MKKILILSEVFNYSKMITYDAGPGYAKRMGWSCDYLGNISRHKNQILIIDNRITELECFKLEEFFLLNQEQKFLLKVVDPYKEWCQNNPYYKFLFRVKEFENIFFLSIYTPKEIVQDLDASTNRKKMIVIPYPFVDKYSVSSDFCKRSKKIIFSGNQHRDVYPYRYKFNRQIKFNPFLWNKIHFLNHPGYPDINQRLKHILIGDKYIDYLSKFMFMFISPSRCGLEFLKYSECAYARCIPVGKSPLSFSENLRKFFIELNFDNLFKSINYLFSIPESELRDISRNYYSTLEQERNPGVLNAKLDNFLELILK